MVRLDDGAGCMFPKKQICVFQLFRCSLGPFECLSRRKSAVRPEETTWRGASGGSSKRSGMRRCLVSHGRFLGSLTPWPVVDKPSRNVLDLFFCIPMLFRATSFFVHGGGGKKTTECLGDGLQISYCMPCRGICSTRSSMARWGAWDHTQEIGKRLHKKMREEMGIVSRP
ncbi:hypothetical protein LZ32DRAFT_93392 [Colletotrichum eremochloae]|nr:hypothetical protein LZ32DRAFT_93392 [Colletotrichum eremochloae]